MTDIIMTYNCQYIAIMVCLHAVVLRLGNMKYEAIMTSCINMPVTGQWVSFKGFIVGTHVKYVTYQCQYIAIMVCLHAVVLRLGNLKYKAIMTLCINVTVKAIKKHC